MVYKWIELFVGKLEALSRYEKVLEDFVQHKKWKTSELAPFGRVEIELIRTIRSLTAVHLWVLQSVICAEEYSVLPELDILGVEA